MENDPKHSPLSELKDEKLLCAELVELRWRASSGQLVAVTANLEEIWAEGATLDAEEPIPIHTQLVLVRPPTELAAEVQFCRDNEAGFTVGLQFQTGHRWSRQLFIPAHSVNPRELIARKPSKPGSGEMTKGAGISSRGNAQIRGGSASRLAIEGSLYCLGVFASPR